MVLLQFPILLRSFTPRYPKSYIVLPLINLQLLKRFILIITYSYKVKPPSKIQPYVSFTTRLSLIIIVIMNSGSVLEITSTVYND